MLCLIWVLRSYMHVLRTCEKCMGEMGLPKCMGMLGFFKWVVVVGWLELACQTTCACLFKVRPGVLSKSLSHIWGKLNLPIFLFNVELFTLRDIDSLIFLAKSCPSLPPYYLEVILSCRMAYVIAMIMFRGGLFQMHFESFSIGPGGFPYVFIITGKVTTLEPIYGPTFVDHGVLHPCGRPVGY